MNLNSNLINKSILENKIHNLKNAHSKTNVVFKNDNDKILRIRQKVQYDAFTNDHLDNVQKLTNMFNDAYLIVDGQNNAVEETVSLRKNIAENQMSNVFNKRFKNIIKTKNNNIFYCVRYNNIMHYSPTGGDNASTFDDCENIESTITTFEPTPLTLINLYKITNKPKNRIYFEEGNVLTNYLVNVNKEPLFVNNADDVAQLDRKYSNRTAIAYPFKPYLDTTLNKIGLKGSYKDSFKFNYPSQNATVPDHVDKNLYGIYSHGYDYTFNLYMASVANANFSGITPSNYIQTKSLFGRQDGINPNNIYTFPNIQDETPFFYLCGPRITKLIEKWFIFNNTKQNKTNYFGIFSNKKITKQFDLYTNNTSGTHKIFYTYSNLETKPDDVTLRYNYGMLCGYTFYEYYNHIDNLEITTLSKSKLPIGTIKKNCNFNFFDIGNHLSHIPKGAPYENFVLNNSSLNIFDNLVIQ